LVTASKEVLMRPKTTKTPPTMAQMLMMNLDVGRFDLVIDIDTGENSKIIITMLSSGWSSAAFLLIVRA
jgi:hypothetical protein